MASLVEGVGRGGFGLLMTTIALLPDDVPGPCLIDVTEDWRDALIFLDASGAPIDITAISFSAAIQQTVNGIKNAIFTVSTDNGLLVPLAGFALAAPVTGGTGYAVNDKINLAGGIGVAPGQLRVTGLGSSGAVASAAMVTPGLYRQLPANPVAQLSTTGVGTGATFNLTWITNALGFVVPVANLPPLLVAGSYTFKLKASADGVVRNVANVALTVV